MKGISSGHFRKYRKIVFKISSIITLSSLLPISSPAISSAFKIIFFPPSKTNFSLPSTSILILFGFVNENSLNKKSNSNIG